MPFTDTQFFEYLPVGEQLISWGFYVTGAGEGLFPAHGQYPPQDHPLVYTFKFESGRTLPEYQIHYISTGSGTFTSKPTGTVPIKAGNVFLLFPDLWHTYRPDPDIGWQEYWASLNGKFLYHLVQQGIISPRNAVFYPGVHDSILNPFIKLIRQMKSRPSENSLMLSVLSLEILAAAIEAAPTPSRQHTFPAQAYHDTLINDTIDLIWSHSYHRISVEQIARAMSVTRRTLIRRFGAATGSTVADEITRCRLERAARLLRETNMPVKQIAFKVGFGSAERMSKVFRREIKTTPTDYRANPAP